MSAADKAKDKAQEVKGKVKKNVGQAIGSPTMEGEGKADVRQALATGFGVHVAFLGHDMHGLRMGPDGKLYFSIGDRGFNVTTADGRHLFNPDSGAVLPAYVISLRSGLGLGWMFVVAAEFMGASEGLGYLLIDGQQLGKPGQIVAAIVAFAILGKLSDWLIVLLSAPFLRWEDVVARR